MEDYTNDGIEEEDLSINESLVEEIKAKAATLKKTKKVRRVIPIAVEGDKDSGDDKDMYVIYFKEPSFKDFSKFNAMGKSNETQALRQLAKDCFLDGDSILFEDDSLFLFGLMSQVITIIKFRKSRIVNL